MPKIVHEPTFMVSFASCSCSKGSALSTHTRTHTRTHCTAPSACVVWDCTKVCALQPNRADIQADSDVARCLQPMVAVCGDAKYPDVAQQMWKALINLAAMDHKDIECVLFLSFSIVLSP